MDIDARREPLVHQRARDLIRTRIVGHRRQNQYDISHFTSCTLGQGGVLCDHVSKDGNHPAPKRRAPTPGGTSGRSRRIVRWILLFVAVLIVVNGLVGDRGLLAMLRARREYDELAAQIARQRAENSRLRDRAQRLRDDPAAIEEVARRELGLIKPGEKVFIIKNKN